MRMYKLKPVIDSSVKINVSKCMYKMKNIHDTNESINHVQTVSSILNITEQNNPILPQMAALEERQEKILKQLENLKIQMSNIRSELKLCAKPIQPVAKMSKQEPLNVSSSEMISIKVHPNYIPYFLLAFKKLWEGRLQVTINFYVHSSVKKLPRNAQEFSEMIENGTENTSAPELNISVIWKEVKNNIEMIVTSTRIPIIGETNVIRYLARIDPNTWNYDESDDFVRTLSIDSILDICYRLSQSTTKTEKQALLRNINNKLAKSQWLAGTENLSVADIAAFSVLKQLELIKELNVNMSKWAERYQIAVK